MLATIEDALGGPGLAWLVPLLGLTAALDRRTRRLALPLLSVIIGSSAITVPTPTRIASLWCRRALKRW